MKKMYSVDMSMKHIDALKRLLMWALLTPTLAREKVVVNNREALVDVTVNLFLVPRVAGVKKGGNKKIGVMVARSGKRDW